MHPCNQQYVNVMANNFLLSTVGIRISENLSLPLPGVGSLCCIFVVNKQNFLKEIFAFN